jgi:YD repeat-containing protein
MRFSILAGWVYSVVRMVGGEAESHTKSHANRVVARDLDCAESNLQTLVPAGRYSQNGVKMPVDIGVFISLRVNWVWWLLQNLSQWLACMIVAWKERSEPKAQTANVTSNWTQSIRRSALVLFLTLSAAAQACIYQGSTTPCPADCVEDGGEKLCVKPIPVPTQPQYPYDGQKWRYTQGLLPGTDYDVYTWCAAGGGTWGVDPQNPNTTTCIGYPPGNSDSYIVPWSTEFLERYFPSCPGTVSMQSDTGWGIENFDGVYAYAANAKTRKINDIEITSYRRMMFNGVRSKRPDGSCEGNAYTAIIDAVRYRSAQCPAGYLAREMPTSTEFNKIIKCVQGVQDKCTAPCGNPILAGSGTKIQPETDYAANANSPLVIKRLYRSPGFFSLDSTSNIDPRNFGRYWRGAYDKRVHRVLDNVAISAFAEREDGMLKSFNASGDEVQNFGNAREKLVTTTSGWRYTTSSDDMEDYDTNGRLLSITNRGGSKQTLTYSDATTPASVAPFAGLLIAVTDSFGRRLQFSYNSIGLIKQIINPQNGVFAYAYDANNNLETVTSPDGKSRMYKYNESEHVGSAILFSGALTGIVDENGVRFATFKYDSVGRGISSEHAGGVAKYSVSYIYTNEYSQITDPLGTKRDATFSRVLGVVRAAGNFQPATSGLAASSSSTSYDANGNVIYKTDFNGNAITYSYDLARNLETSRTEASGTANTRTTTTTWHPTYRLPATITEPITGGTKTTTHTYDTNGNLTQRAVTTPQATRTWLWSGYDAYGRASSMTDPRGKVTTYVYYPNTAAQNTTLANSRGMLASITNAVGHVTNIAGYNAHGQPLAMTDANGLMTSMTYDARMRLKSRTVSGTGINETTNYDYDGVGQLIKVTLPDASFITYTYDGAHRLTQIQDSQANKIVYTLDSMGNRTAEQAYDPAGLLARSRTRVYDALNRLKQDIGVTTPATQISQYG